MIHKRWELLLLTKSPLFPLIEQMKHSKTLTITAMQTNNSINKRVAIK